MVKSPRCLYESDIDSFLGKQKESIFGILCENYHGDAQTTTREREPSLLTQDRTNTLIKKKDI